MHTDVLLLVILIGPSCPAPSIISAVHPAGGALGGFGSGSRTARPDAGGAVARRLPTDGIVRDRMVADFFLGHHGFFPLPYCLGDELGCWAIVPRE